MNLIELFVVVRLEILMSYKLLWRCYYLGRYVTIQSLVLLYTLRVIPQYYYMSMHHHVNNE